MKKKSTAYFTFLLPAFLFLLLFPSVCYTQSLSNEPAQNAYETREQVSQNILEIDVWVFLSGRYELFDLNIQDEVTVEITTPLPPTPNVISAVIPFTLTKVLPPDLNYTYGFWGYPPVGILSIYLPANTSLTEPIRLEGYVSGKSVLWRNTAETFFLNITSPVTPVSSYRLVLVPPSPSRFLKVYSRFYPDLRYQEASVNGQRCIVVSETRAPIVVLYEPTAWKVYALIVMFITIFVFYMLPYLLESRKIGAKTSNLIMVFRRRLLPKPIILKRLYSEVSKLNSSKLLTMFILCGLLMTSLSFVAGPEPRLKVYVLASTPGTARTITDFVYREAGAVAITTFDEMSEFGLLVDLGVFSAAIIGDFFPPDERTVKAFIYPALDDVRSIIILKSYAVDAFSSEIQRRYADKTIIIEDLDALPSALLDIERRTNALGLNISPATYIGVSGFVGLCSLIIVFLGLAFLACKLVEVGKKPGVGGFAEAIAYSVLYFVFTQTVYTVCTLLLAMPLGLHTSSPKVTAVGFMGFGGGSRPRMFAGLAGFLFGSLISLKGGLKLDKAGFISFLVVSFFIIIDPLTSGVIFYEFVLLYTAGPPHFETAFTTQSYIKTFLAEIGVALGGWATPIYGISTGTILYYAGAIPFCLFPKLKRSTATVLLFFCAFCAASGGIRLADMKPWASIASLIPGVMAGFIFAALFCLISLTETMVKTKIGKRGSVV